MNVTQWKWRMSVAAAAAIVLLLAGPALLVADEVRWDDGDGNTGSYSGAAFTWANLQAAINSAQGNSATPGSVKISGNLARPTDDATGSLLISTGAITLSGGWDGSFSTQDLATKSTLNVNGGATGTNQFRVLNITGSGATVDNLVLTGGYEKGIVTPLYSPKGAGVYVNGANNTTLQNLRVTGNQVVTGYTGASGAGIAAVGNSTNRVLNLKISHCEVDHNTGLDTGGGIYLSDVGTAAAPGIVEYSNVHDNTMASPNYQNANKGAGICLVGDASTRVLIANTKITGNSGRIGAGVFSDNFDTGHTPIFFGCLIAGNTQQTTGGSQGAAALVSTGRNQIYLANTTVADNVSAADALSAGVYLARSSYSVTGHAEFVNSVLSNNRRLMVVAQAVGFSGSNNFDFLRSTLNETLYDKLDSTTPNNQTATTLAGALAFTAAIGFHSRNDSGTETQNMELNNEGNPLFLGSGSDPYQLTASSTLSLDNGLTLQGTNADFSGPFKYVDVNHNSAYNPALDVIVDLMGSTKTGSAAAHFVYVTDLAGNLRLGGTGIDRGAYELAVPEPATLALLVLGGAAMIAGRGGRRRAR